MSGISYLIDVMKIPLRRFVSVCLEFSVRQLYLVHIKCAYLFCVQIIKHSVRVSNFIVLYMVYTIYWIIWLWPWRSDRTIAPMSLANNNSNKNYTVCSSLDCCLLSVFRCEKLELKVPTDKIMHRLNGRRSYACRDLYMVLEMRTPCEIFVKFKKGHTTG